MRHMWRSNESGFTVVELALVMVIVAMVVGVFSQMLISANQSASIARQKSRLAEICTIPWMQLKLTFVKLRALR